MENDWWLLILRNHSQCTTSTSLMKNHSMVKKILKILSEKKVYYIFLFLKVSQCKFEQQKNNFEARKPPQKQGKIQNRLGCFPSSTPTRASPWTHLGPNDSRSNFLSVYNSKISPYQNLYWKHWISKLHLKHL